MNKTWIVLLAVLATQTSTEAEEQPNIIFIMADDK